jgi:hypothetical protein
MKKVRKVMVSQRALVQRINRRLAKENRKLCAARGFNAGGTHYDDTNLGRFYVIDAYRNAVVDTRVDIADLARDLSVLKNWEELQDA